MMKFICRQRFKTDKSFFAYWKQWCVQKITNAPHHYNVPLIDILRCEQREIYTEENGSRKAEERIMAGGRHLNSISRLQESTTRFSTCDIKSLLLRNINLAT